MKKSNRAGRARHEQHGATLVMVALSLVVLLGISALAIDLASLYVARTEAQRAADAAALAGATTFVRSGFTSGLVTQATVQTMAANAAQAAGNKNLVGGKSPNIGTTFNSSCPPSASSDGCFNFTIAGDPRITVVVRQTMPTFFIRIFNASWATANISAQATAEAYNPSGGGPPVTVKCLKPWILPNCDPDPTHTTPNNSSCAGLHAFFYNTTACSNTSIPGICYPGSVAKGGVIGAELTLKSADPSNAPAPSQFYPVDIPPGTTPAQCPPASAPGCSSLSGGGGAALYRQNIACCNTSGISCGTATVSWKTGNMVGPTAVGVRCLIHANGDGLNQGQDSIDTSTTPFTYTGGSNNPNPNLRGVSGISDSDSIVTIPLYNGGTPCPGASCGSSVTIVGYLTIFIKQVTPKDPSAGTDEEVKAIILDVAGCGSSGSGGGGGPVSSGGSSPIPVRLVQPGN